MISAAIYARVSSDRQEQEETIQSQLAELRTQVKEDGLTPCQEFTDEGYSRDNLVRPGLDRLRDLVTQGECERIYIQCPDRLASGAKLMLLVEEFQQHGADVVFLKGSVDETPEGKLLLHMQGAIAEYERTKIVERTRRGKLYWARQGAMVGGHAPYGYRFVKRNDNERARLEIDESRAPVIVQMYRWIVEDHLSTWAIARRLSAEGVPTARGGASWKPTAVHRMLTNPVYKGQFNYLRAESVTPEKRLTSNPYKQSRKTGRKPRPKQDWIAIPVPAIVNEAIWEQAQAQLKQNSIYSGRNNKRNEYLLRGLIKCSLCGSTCSGQVAHGIRYYRCCKVGVFSPGERCRSGVIRADSIEQTVWKAVSGALKRRDVLVGQYRRQLEHLASSASIEAERKQIEVALRRLKAQEDRITDAYINEAMSLERYKAEMDKAQARRQQLERASRELERRDKLQAEAQSALSNLEQFCDKVAEGLENLTFAERQQLLRLVIERVVVRDGRVRIEGIVPIGGEGVELRTRRHHERD